MSIRPKVNLSLDPGLTAEARALGLNMSRIAEQALAKAIKEARNRVWIEQNRAALDAYTAEVERDGLPLGRFRSF